MRTGIPAVQAENESWNLRLWFSREVRKGARTYHLGSALLSPWAQLVTSSRGPATVLRATGHVTASNLHEAREEALAPPVTDEQTGSERFENLPKVTQTSE